MKPFQVGRQAGETFPAYVKRRRELAARVMLAERSRMVHVSSRPATLPAAGVDAQADEAVRRGHYRDIRVLVRPEGDIRVCRTKGETYRRIQGEG